MALAAIAASASKSPEPLLSESKQSTKTQEKVAVVAATTSTLASQTLVRPLVAASGLLAPLDGGPLSIKPIRVPPSATPITPVTPLASSPLSPPSSAAVRTSTGSILLDVGPFSAKPIRATTSSTPLAPLTSPVSPLAPDATGASVAFIPLDVDLPPATASSVSLTTSTIEMARSAKNIDYEEKEGGPPENRGLSVNGGSNGGGPGRSLLSCADAVQCIEIRQVIPARLNSTQISIYNAILRGYMENSIKRKFVYIFEHPQQIFTLSCKQIRNVSCAALGGAIVGSIVPSVGSGALAGIAAGLGYVTAVGVNIRDALKTPAFLAWTRLREARLKDQAMVKFLLEDDVLQYLLCPISENLPEIPVTVVNDINRITFNLKDISEWLINHPGEPFAKGKMRCMRVGPHGEPIPLVFTTDDLRFDFVYISTVLARFEALLQACLNQEPLVRDFQAVKQTLSAHLPESLLELILAYHAPRERISRIYRLCALKDQELAEQRRWYVQDHITSLLHQVSKGELDSVQFGMELQKLKSKLGQRKIPTLEHPTWFWRLFNYRSIVLKYDVIEANDAADGTRGEYDARALSLENRVLHQILKLPTRTTNRI